MPKDAQTTAQLHWTHMLVMFKLVLEKAEEPEIKFPTSAGSSKKQESSRKKKKEIYVCFIDYVKAVYCHLAYLNYAKYIMWNARLDEAQDGIKTAGRNINNLR